MIGFMSLPSIKSNDNVTCCWEVCIHGTGLCRDSMAMNIQGIHLICGTTVGKMI